MRPRACTRGRACADKPKLILGVAVLRGASRRGALAGAVSKPPRFNLEGAPRKDLVAPQSRGSASRRSPRRARIPRPLAASRRRVAVARLGERGRGVAREAPDLPHPAGLADGALRKPPSHYVHPASDRGDDETEEDQSECRHRSAPRTLPRPRIREVEVHAATVPAESERHHRGRGRQGA